MAMTVHLFSVEWSMADSENDGGVGGRNRDHERTCEIRLWPEGMTCPIYFHLDEDVAFVRPAMS
jgi:hypothetical protein